MINREITYERDVNRSYMKIPAVMETCLDEKLMFRKPYHGILPMEKCYVNGLGQYWYNISGKQALDAYCRMHSINQSFFETLILRICSQLELLEWNLMDSSCLVVDPELIFVNAGGDEISFILYPDTKGTFIEELQQLMEYLLTKLNHGDSVGVHQAYEIYNMVLKGDYSIAELKEAILKRREPEVLQHEEVEIPMVEEESIAEESIPSTDPQQTTNIAESDSQEIVMQKIQKAKQMLEDGIITEEEFSQIKARLIEQM